MSYSLKQLYGNSAQAVTITLAGVVNAAARRSAVIDNSFDLARDVLLAGSITASASPAPTGCVNVYVYGTTDNGATYTDAADGLDADHTLAGNAILLGSLVLNASAQVAQFGPWNVAEAFGGALPQKWGVIVENQSGDTLADGALKFQSIGSQAI